jgi:DNA repair protein RadA
LPGNAILIDTQNTFRPEKIHQVAENRGIKEPEDILRKIYVYKIFNSGHLELIIQNLGKSTRDYKAKIVIVDSIISLHRLHKLVRLAEVYNIAIVVTNQE